MTRYSLFTGSETERARQKGLAQRENFTAVFESLLRAPFLPETWKRWIPDFVTTAALRHVGRKYARLHEPYLRRFGDQDLFAPWQALAAGLNRDLPLVYGMSAIEVLSSVMAFQMGCTSLAFAGYQTEDGQPRLAYNHDFPESFGAFLTIEEERPENGYATLALTYPTILGAIAGVNEKGLAVSLNHAFATDVTPKPAILITALVRECLRHAGNVAEAIALAQAAEVPNGSMLTFADAAGDRAVLEVSATRKSVRRESEGVLATFNCYHREEMSVCEIPKSARTAGLTRRVVGDRLIHEHNLKRTERYSRLIDGQRKYDDAAIRRLLSDHDGGEGAYHTICRHDPQTMCTIASAILNPTQKTMRVIFGNACRGEEQIFTLQDR